MRSLLSKVRHDAADVIDRAVEGYESAWKAGRPSIGQFWQACTSSGSISILAALVKVDLRRRFEHDDRPRVAEYLEEFPALATSGDRVVSLVYEEFCLREEYGEAPDSVEFCDAYGPWRDSLLSQLAYHRQLSQAVGAESPPVNYPRAGERFEKYRIRSLLGVGGAARVYLATEAGLGDRKVALKVSASFGQETTILARLDHRNIVPILAVAESESGLRGFSMPYRPGVTLEELIRRIAPGTPPRSARALWKAIAPAVAADRARPDNLTEGWDGFPIDGTFAEGVAWIGLALANALAYLHGEGVFHRDIKPANVLLAFREGPQLLDFNLAQDPGSPEQAKVAFRGGTLPYMAPEHLRAFIDPSGWDSVNSAADIYSLGLVLQQLVTGRPPDLPSANLSVPRGIQSLLDRRSEPMTPVRELNPSVPPALESIISKSLAFDPSARYASGSDLADDLRRFLDRKSLRHAPNTSTVERAVNLAYRHRFLAVGLTCLLGILWISTALRNPSHVPKLSQFRRAALALDSGRPDDRERARVDLEEIRKLHPGSAWPLLFLGLVQEKCGGPLLTEATRNIEEATRCPDAEEAITERLRKEPKSATLLTALGMVLVRKKEFDRARKPFNLAIEADPGRIQALLELVKLETGPARREKAIQAYSKAIKLGESANIGSDRLLRMRRSLLPHLLQESDSLIDSGPSAPERVRAKVHLVQLGATLDAIKLDLDQMTMVSSGQILKFSDLFYRGCLASCRIVLAADRDDHLEARRLAEEARKYLDEALKSVPEGVQNRHQFQTEAEAQRAKLEARCRKYVSEKLPTPLLSVDRH